MKLLIINGPNLNLLGKREPNIYGDTSLEEIQNFTVTALQDRKINVDLEWRHSNLEGEIINWIQDACVMDGLVINPGGYTHSSVAILDALKSLNIPKVEVHLSLVSAREDYRQRRITTVGCHTAIEGAGKFAYLLAIEYIHLLHINLSEVD